MSRTNGTGVRIFPLVIYCGLVFALSSIPDPSPPDLGLTWADKLVHAGAYAIMGGLAFRAAGAIAPRMTTLGLIAMAVAFCAFYGASDELHQAFVPGRDADALDWVADVSGAIMGIVGISRSRFGRREA